MMVLFIALHCHTILLSLDTESDLEMPIAATWNLLIMSQVKKYCPGTF